MGVTPATHAVAPSLAADTDIPDHWAAAALAADFGQRQLPRALGLHAQVAAGEPLTADDEAMLVDMLEALASAGILFGHPPEIDALHRCALSLYDDIMTEAFVQLASKRPVF